jgi:hypothetical protein
MYAATGKRIIEWLEFGASIKLAFDPCDLDEKDLDEWRRLARIHPTSPMGKLVASMKALEAEHCGGNGHEPYVSPTGNIRGHVPSNNGNGELLPNGHALPHHLVRWDD